mmetsp:Transcript_24438/g.60075  ORF Transcript_24438/g.60075 Transcript_24438/m.60075 type:complete len:232 (+) Transcript_24438:686-1381(+)
MTLDSMIVINIQVGTTSQALELTQLCCDFDFILPARDERLDQVEESLVGVIRRTRAFANGKRRREGRRQRRRGRRRQRVDGIICHPPHAPPSRGGRDAQRRRSLRRPRRFDERLIARHVVAVGHGLGARLHRPHLRLGSAGGLHLHQDHLQNRRGVDQVCVGGVVAHRDDNLRFVVGWRREARQRPDGRDRPRGSRDASSHEHCVHGRHQGIREFQARTGRREHRRPRSRD